MTLDGKVAIVTGGSSGIGRAIARRFADEGASVVVADVAGSGIDEASFVQADVSSPEAVDELVDSTLERHGRLDVLVNNAATWVGKPLLETTLEEWERVFAVNLTGVFLLSRRAVRQMLAQEPRDGVRGRIVNISSQHGMIAAPADIAYGTSKSGVVYITRQIARDYASDGIVCNAVAPGKIMTGKGGLEDDPDSQAYWRSRTPWPRLGEPDDVARAAVFLASDEATYITGENLMVDGGWSAS